MSGIGLFVCAVLAIGAALKLRDLKSFATSLEQLGVSPKLLSLVFLVPLLEGALAATLLSPCRKQGAFAILLMVACFSAVVVAARVAGRTGSCLCFGRVLERQHWLGPIAAVLLSGAALALAAGDPGRENPTACGPAPPLWAASSVALVALLLAGMNLAWQAAGTRRGDHRSAGSGANESAGLQGISAERLVDLADGRDIRLSALLSERRLLALVFASPDCKWCGAMVPELEAWAVKVGQWIDVALVYSDGGKPRSPATDGERIRTLVQRGDGLSRTLGIAGTPSMVYLLPDGSPGGPVMGGIAPMRVAMRQLEDRIGARPA